MNVSHRARRENSRTCGYSPIRTFPRPVDCGPLRSLQVSLRMQVPDVFGTHIGPEQINST